ncbi:hypothetical protein HELRODRAFT_184058 [Helobdella robusta]|uniref:Uncharacterized protein n=1 Tax=Helobdella robusta TaxID=6412 RepID=T1FKI1_HELRO|nr:hypothetical protein HELRODRAFT_184058 [Helobdella robusta]ESO08299.1 hypothetical protein HELRODRAFT_184058 [Helobdella robusta]
MATSLRRAALFIEDLAFKSPHFNLAKRLLTLGLFPRAKCINNNNLTTLEPPDTSPSVDNNKVTTNTTATTVATSAKTIGTNTNWTLSLVFQNGSNFPWTEHSNYKFCVTNKKCKKYYFGVNFNNKFGNNYNFCNNNNEQSNYNIGDNKNKYSNY